MNRGIARRTLFDRREDMRVFQRELEAAVERREIEVHAYCLMGTHYHLLVRSPKGELSIGMQRVQTAYSRWFNRSRKRDGTLVRARYRSKRVDSLRYRHAVVAYIDRNPVKARLVRRPEDYPFGSAREYSGLGERSPWLARSWIESAVMRTVGSREYEPRRYPDVFGRMPDALRKVVEARWRSAKGPDPLDDLLSAASGQVRRWMRRKARLADGVPPGVPVVDRRSIRQAIERVSVEEGRTWELSGRSKRSGWTVLEAGLTRDLGGDRLEEIAETFGVSVSTARSFVRLHRRLLRSDALYSRRSTLVAERALAVWGWMRPG